MGMKNGGISAFLASLDYEFYKYRDGEIFKLAEGDFPEGNILALPGK